jgi:cyclohexa-1,5-dienecarbonyl-CoA hydratase
MTQPVSLALTADGARAAFRLFHPKGNIVTEEMLAALEEGLQDVARNPHLKFVTIEGAGEHFSFGASIPEHAPDLIRDVLPKMHRAVLSLLDVPAVTAAIVRGRCLGGGFELALACDFIFASDDATFGLPEVTLGVFPPAASALLPARVGAARAASAILSGAPRPAADWHAAGLVEEIAPGADLAGLVDRWFARTLAAKSATALRYAAAAARGALREQAASLLPGLERLYLDGLMRTEDAVEGIAAFLEKRAPRWSDQ